MLGRCVLGIGGWVALLKGGRDAKPVGLFLGAMGPDCIWSSLTILWNTSPETKSLNAKNKITVQLKQSPTVK